LMLPLLPRAIPIVAQYVRKEKLIAGWNHGEHERRHKEIVLKDRVLRYLSAPREA
jgi:hypothetical protein